MCSGSKFGFFISKYLEACVLHVRDMFGILQRILHTVPGLNSGSDGSAVSPARFSNIIIIRATS